MSQKTAMLHEKTDIEQCIWKAEDIWKIFLFSVKAGLRCWFCHEGCSALPLTPGCMIILPWLVLMLSLQIWLNTNPYWSKIITIALLNQWAYPSHQLVKWIVMPRKASDENWLAVTGRQEEQGEGEEESSMSPFSRRADKLKAVVKWYPLASIVIFIVAACLCCFRNILLREKEQNNSRSLGY